jgi:hypothetical protein
MSLPAMLPVTNKKSRIIPEHIQLACLFGFVFTCGTVGSVYVIYNQMMLHKNLSIASDVMTSNLAN